LCRIPLLVNLQAENIYIDDDFDGGQGEGEGENGSGDVGDDDLE
jgi:hypothetical protein